MKFLGIILGLFLFLLVISPHVYAQEAISLPTQGITPTQIPTPTTVSYELPYSGLVPGSTLYPLKALRDKILEIFITDPAKKSNFYLLQADKRMSASLTLFESNKDVLAETTLSKGQNYLEKSINNAVVAKESQRNIMDILPKLKASSAFQKQEIEKLTKVKKGETGQKLTEDYKRAEYLQKRVEEIKP
jgi:hypothetical protein